MTNEISRIFDALAVSTIINLDSHMEDNSKVETYYQRAVRNAENTHGPLHGEVGLALIRLADFYRNEGRSDDAAILEERIADITEIYRSDLET